MSPRTGRPTDAKKDERLQIRVSKDTIKELDECVELDNSNRSEVVRKGIKLVKSELNQKK